MNYYYINVIPYVAANLVWPNILYIKYNIGS